MTSRRRVGSVVIPAHNESAVIARCLHHLFDGIEAADLEVVVVCNGCRDDTAAVARACGHPIEVIDLAVASKPAALRAGDRLLRTFPRLYLDADVVLPGRAALRVLEHLGRNDSVAARPPFRYETAHSSALVRRYYRARSQVPAVMGSIWGAGVYGLSAAGRTRFGDYPDLIADDLFVDRCFRKDEIDIVGDEPVVVMAPAHYRDLLKVMRRAYRGAAETVLASGGSTPQAAVPGSTTTSTLRDVLRLCRSPSGLVDAATYAFVAISARVYIALGRSARWERDESSRSLTAAPPTAGSAS
jgi:glycosyltransferase involved in cell wall biosynthesis